MKGTNLMPTTTIMREYYYGYVAVLSLLLGSLSSEAFLLSPLSSSSRDVFSVNHPSQHRVAALQVGASVPYFAVAAEASAKTSSEASTTLVNQGGSNNNKNDNDDDEKEGFDPYAKFYAKLGIKEEDLAISINPEEVLKYIGTREDIIQKTLSDVPKMQRPQAEIEVDKFLLDAEAIQVFLEFKKRKEADPDFLVPKEEKENGFFSARNAVYFYVAYVAYSSGPIYMREYVQSQVEAGTWKGTGIPQLDEWLMETPATAAAIVATTVDALTNTASSSAAATSDASVISDTILQAAQLVAGSLN